MTSFTGAPTATANAIDEVLLSLRELTEQVGDAYRVARAEGDADAMASLLAAANKLTALSCEL
jgi:hypothetical protein